MTTCMMMMMLSTSSIIKRKVSPGKKVMVSLIHVIYFRLVEFERGRVTDLIMVNYCLMSFLKSKKKF